MEGTGGGGEQEKSYSRPFMSQGSQGEVHPFCDAGIFVENKIRDIWKFIYSSLFIVTTSERQNW